MPFSIEPIHVYGAIAAAIGALLASDWLRERGRRRGLQAFAGVHGLTFAARRDELGTQQLPYFLSGQNRRCRNVLSGAWEGVTVTVFDYTHTVVVGQAMIGSRRAERVRTCVLLDSGLSARQLDIAWRRAWDDFPASGALIDVPAGHEDFDRTWRMRATDPRFAQQVLGEELRTWLVAAGPDVRFELGGRWLLLVSARAGPQQLPALLGAAREFRARIGPQARELHPAR